MMSAADVRSFGLTSAKAKPSDGGLNYRGTMSVAPLAGVYQQQERKAEEERRQDYMHLTATDNYSDEVHEAVNISFARAELANILMREAIDAVKAYVGEKEWRGDIRRYAKDVRYALSQHDALMVRQLGEKCIDKYDDICGAYEDEARKYTGYLEEQVRAGSPGCPTPLIKAYSRVVAGLAGLDVTNIAIMEDALRFKSSRPYLAEVIVGHRHPDRLYNDFKHFCQEFRRLYSNRERQTGHFDRLIYEPRLTKSAIKRLADFIKRQAPIRRALKKAAREEKKRKEADAL